MLRRLPDGKEAGAGYLLRGRPTYAPARIAEQ